MEVPGVLIKPWSGASMDHPGVTKLTGLTLERSDTSTVHHELQQRMHFSVLLCSSALRHFHKASLQFFTAECLSRS
jgi:hypothetical protein